MTHGGIQLSSTTNFSPGSGVKEIDQEIARHVAGTGLLWCGGPLYRSADDRKLYGSPYISATVKLPGRRIRFCCRREVCRRRDTPPSVISLGRRVYLGANVIVAGPWFLLMWAPSWAWVPTPACVEPAEFRRASGAVVEDIPHHPEHPVYKSEMRGAETILQHIGRTPLVPLVRLGAGLPVPVLVKCEHMNPGGSIKDRIALAIVEDAERRGALRAGMTLIEATAGNTGVGLALVAAARGYGLVCVMPEKMSADKRVALASLGARVVVTPNAPRSSPDNFRNLAQRMAAENGWFLTDQFNNPANVRAHEETTAAEILEQTQGRVGAFVAGAGTGGTISGVGRRLKAAWPQVRIVLADPVGSALADWIETGRPGPDGTYAVEGIGSSDAPANLHREVIDGAERVSDAESFAMTKRLVREEGLLVGGSAGTNVVAALRLAARGDVDGPIVTVLPDSWDRYRAKPWMQEWAS